MKTFGAILLAVCSLPAVAQTPSEISAAYAEQAATSQPGFSASADHGRAFFLKKWNVTEKMPSCTACHTERPSAAGVHAVTSKPIKPLSPAANPQRFSSPAKVEKWFRRNCNDVLGRECTPGEKADFVQYLASSGGAQ